MLLTEPEIRRARELVESAFARFTRWEFVNQRDESYGGFTIWGEYVIPPREMGSTTFFVTFTVWGNHWDGYLTVGKPSYYWSSTDVGDANLLGVGSFATLEEAISALKARIAKLMEALLDSAT